MSSYAESEKRRGSSRPGQLAVFAAKLAVTGFCFWYLSRTVDVDSFLRVARTLDPRWAALAALVLMLEIPLIGLRWCRIVDALGGAGTRIGRAPMIAITAIANFFAQVMPNVAADAIRAWMLTQLGRSWGQGIVTVLIDRAVGVAGLVVVGFGVLLFPSALTALGGYRAVAVEIFAALLVLGFGGLAFAPLLARVLESWRYSAWLGRLARAAHVVLIGSSAGPGIAGLALGVHLMTILSVWLLAQALGLPLSVLDAAVLFTLVVAVALIPVSIAGWGVREVAVTSLLLSRGIPVEQGLVFSVSFGLILLVAALPGALVWAVYSPARQRRDAAART